MGLHGLRAGVAGARGHQSAGRPLTAVSGPPPSQAALVAGVLASLPGLGPVAIRRAVEGLGGLEAAWEAPASAWLDVMDGRLSEQAMAALATGRGQEALAELRRRLQACGATALTPWEPGGGLFPLNLRHLDDVPPVLYVRGSLRLEDRFAVAIVGSRQASPGGRMVAGLMAGELASRGYTVVSGLARGIDAAAHTGAIRAGGRTIAVLPCGIDRVYPPEHARLARAITEHGALVSEYPPGTDVERWRFSVRNRIIAGLSLVVVVAEAREKSGAISTAERAIECGREAMAMPGRPFDEATKGSNALLRDGVIFCGDPLDVEAAAGRVLERLVGWEARGAVVGSLPAELPGMRPSPGCRGVAGSEKADPAVAALSEGCPLEVETLAARTGLPVGRLLASLTRLEAAGVAQRLPDGRWVARSAEIK